MTIVLASKRTCCTSPSIDINIGTYHVDQFSGQHPFTRHLIECTTAIYGCTCIDVRLQKNQSVAVSRRRIGLNQKRVLAPFVHIFFFLFSRASNEFMEFTNMGPHTNKNEISRQCILFLRTHNFSEMLKCVALWTEINIFVIFCF